MLRADDINSTLANGANIINALTNVNEAHSADLARKKQAAMDRLRFDTKIGDDERARQMELLKKYDDDSIFGGIKELMGKYKTENPIVTNAGGEYLDRQVSALTGESPVTKEDNMLSILSQRGDRNMMDKSSYNRMRSDLPNKNIDMNKALTPEESINTYYSPSGLKESMGGQRKNIDVPVEEIKKDKQPKIIKGDVKSYIRKAYENGTFVEEFKGSYSDMDSQNLNMYKPLVDEAVANGDWKAADMLNRQYMANKRSIDKSWGEEEGRGGVDSLFSGPPKDRTAKEKPKKYTVTGTVPIKDANGNITGYDYGKPREVYLTDWERRNPYDPRVQDILERQGVSRHYQSGDLAFNAGESDEAVAGYHKSSAEKGLALRVVQDYENSAKNDYGVAIVRNSEGKPVKQITKKEYESAKASLLPAE